MDELIADALEADDIVARIAREMEEVIRLIHLPARPPDRAAPPDNVGEAVPRADAA